MKKSHEEMNSNRLEAAKSSVFSRKWWRGLLMYRVNANFQTRIWPGRSGIDVEAADWDTLVVCDACRYDLFCETDAPSWFDTFQKATSRASTTPEWLKVTFPDKYGDIVYVAGNPMVSEHVSESFHELIEVWQDAWNEEENVIDPVTVTEAAIEARNEYPNKRIVVHYMQPHAPFYDHPELQFTSYGDFEGLTPEGNEGAGNVWEAVQRGLVTEDEAWEGYRDTLEYVLPEVEKVLQADGMGRRIVTSDHGNVFPRRSFPIPFEYSGHPIGHRTHGLIDVPWGVLPSDDRPEIVEGDIDSKTTAGAQEVEDQLKALGYQ
ncbi:hypothetical protein OB920_16940 [Halobacteria archaeon HArc-gm2]|nr:hypothetical protein [Halobacteria archaeon HArc-gm2]